MNPSPRRRQQSLHSNGDWAADIGRKHLKQYPAKELDAADKRLAAEPELLAPLRDAPHR